MLLGKYRVKTYKFRAFRKEDITLVEKMLDHIKENKVMHVKLVFMVVLMLHIDINVYGNEFASSLDRVGNQIIDMLSSFAKWGCIGMGTKTMIVTLLNGGNMKQAMTEGIQYWIGFLFIQFYPQLFEMFNGIKF
ncbi:hypothetical protein [Romboutsia sp. 1001216sp1]|uniref:hypothetical protein n=1 Tax=Romboutsia sp. 1001216sp1 TaxID=2986997 RepID=UPI00232BEB82|nr:hypothetical protein [Romboutsia sp. 1001216sp1]MDB8804997.1 hypothetical protein [Romboutsia sp. 1001216sp1]MDB8807987.1 hypothetical protein [Romboutsia sp. 1001216sp1]MDB8810642.1 hypothetical protein [Romboutsia sp. 1001216sp1]MDB8816362.1 hypothetical protein [Romboutsia sp. 1001216sp1]MDB8818685.1 hypothetical protein [Romboutsia sp. 1001216sp1]